MQDRVSEDGIEAAGRREVKQSRSEKYSLRASQTSLLEQMSLGVNPSDASATGSNSGGMEAQSATEVEHQLAWLRSEPFQENRGAGHIW
jgi:hypothetical protein